jgi:hypothetical protein
MATKFIKPFLVREWIFVARARASRTKDQPPKWDRFMARRWKLRAKRSRRVGYFAGIAGNLRAFAASLIAEV